MEFKIGDAVKFIDYEEYGDWKRHKNETAVIIEFNNSHGATDSMDIRVTWNDGDISAVSPSNLIMEKVVPNKVPLHKVPFLPLSEENIGLSETMGAMLRQVALPHDYKKSILEALCQTDADKYDKIFVKWGFGSTLEKGKGIILLFYGPPGTGKTMCAQAIAEHLGRKHMILGTADLQSPIPGQMERKIKEAFAKAKSEKLVIVLDECDSLLYNRNHVGPIMGAEINCLLSEIERFEGVCVLTTNRSTHLDQALERRIALKLKFDPPDAATRTIIWRRLIPQECPLSACVDLKKLANDYELSGGHIKNIILAAARKAAYANQDAILMSDLIVCADKELKGAGAFKTRKATKEDGQAMRGEFVKRFFDKEEGGIENGNGKGRI